MDTMQKGNAIEADGCPHHEHAGDGRGDECGKPATETLRVLTDEQKKIADQLIGNDCGAM
jgi:hypothetical protein